MHREDDFIADYSCGYQQLHNFKTSHSPIHTHTEQVNNICATSFHICGRFFEKSKT